jgi:hypothetical protein
VTPDSLAHRFLSALMSRGGRCLSFVLGDVARHLPPPERAGEEALVALAWVIRALHEASAGWVPLPDSVRAGHGVAVLLRVYARCLDGHDQLWNTRIYDALRDGETS